MIQLLFWLLFSLFLKILALFVYPIIYPLRNKLRSGTMVGGTIYIPKGGSLGRLLWFVLDDSIVIENRGGFHVDKEYCYYGKRSFIVESFIPKWFFKDFFRSYYWGAIRNSFINFSRWHAFIKVGCLTSIINHINFGNEKSYYQYREFYFSNRPYLQLWYGKFFLQVGFISNGRFEAEIKFNKRG